MKLEKDFSPLLEPVFRGQLLELASGNEKLVKPFDNWQFAKLPNQPNEAVPYVRIENSSKPILLIPGFTEGILNKAPLAVDLARRGHSLIVVGENRNGILKDDQGKKSATLTQAENIMAVLKTEGLDKAPKSVDVVAHSYGSLIFEEMNKLAEKEGLPCFDDSKVVLLDPAGFIHNESIFRLGYGFLRNVITESSSKKDFPDPNMYAFKAGLAYGFANKSRSAREIFEISRKKIDYKHLMQSSIGSLAILSFGESHLFPSRAQLSTIEKMMSLPQPRPSIVWATPATFNAEIIHNGGPYFIDGATHNDDQFNPTRVGGAIDQLL